MIFFGKILRLAWIRLCLWVRPSRQNFSQSAASWHKAGRFLEMVCGLIDHQNCKV
jgi:hypothetical protein